MMATTRTKQRTITKSESSDKDCGCNKVHYANMSVQYTAIFHGCKNDNFQMKIFDIFLIFAQNKDCGYTLEPPQRGGSNEYPIYVLEQK